jgi:hypothetical protein
MVFKAGSNEYPFEFWYGSDSEGPPQELGQFVAAAVELTNPWFEESRAKAGKGRWKFWKPGGA